MYIMYFTRMNGKTISLSDMIINMKYYASTELRMDVVNANVKVYVYRCPSTLNNTVNN